MPVEIRELKKPEVPGASNPVTEARLSFGSLTRTVGCGLLVLLGTIGALELIFGIAGIGEEEYLKPDPIIGACGIPNKTITYRKEGFGRFRYNSFGMQDIERSPAKPAGTRRIICLGDSLVEALQVDRSENFCNLLERQLNAGTARSAVASHGPRFEVLNFGVSMSNLAQMYLRMKHRAFQFQPDIVIVPVRVDAALQLSPNAEGGFLTARPNFFADGKGGLIEDRSVQKLWQSSPEGKRMRATAWLREHSHIWGVISHAAEQLLGWIHDMKAGRAHWGADVSDKRTAFAMSAAGVPQTPTEPANSTSEAELKAHSSTKPESKPTSAIIPASGGAPVQNDVNKVPDTRYFAAATQFEWQVVEPLIKMMKRECDQHNCTLVLLRLPGGNDWRNDLETKLLNETAQRAGIPVLDTTEPFHQAWLKREQLFYATHFTPFSHQLMANQLYEFLRERGLNQ